MLRRLVLLCTAWTAFGCPDPPPPEHARAPRGPRVQAYTDSAAISAVVVAPPWALAGTDDGLDRFDLRTGARTHYGAVDGLPSDRVVAMVADAGGKTAWVAGGGGLAVIDLAAGTLRPVPAPVSEHAAAAAGLVAMTADPDGGVWVGSTAGLYHADDDGIWRPAGFTRPITALHADDGGDLYLGTETGLVVRHTDGSYRALEQGDGCALARVTFIVEAPDGTPVVGGEDATGHPRIAFLVGDRFVTYRPSPEVRFVGGARRLDDLVIATPDKLFTLSPPRGGARTLRRDGLRLVAVTGNQRSPYVIRPVDVVMPPGATVLASAGGEVFVGTRTLGTARFTLDGKNRARWLRRRDLGEGATDLSVACAAAADCYLATGAEHAWRYDGSHFLPAAVTTEDDAVVLAMAKAPDGEVLALFRAAEERRLSVARLDGKAFTPVAELSIETPGGITAITFAKFSPDGLLWLGLEYLDEESEPRPYGVATIDLSLGLVTYHHQRAGNNSRRTGVLPIPNDVADIAFIADDQNLEVWLATASGAARMKLPGEQLTVFTEAEGLESEILHGIVATDGGLVFVASSRGIGEFDGQRWTFPRALALTANSLALGADGRLWIGTDRGLMAYDGRRLERIDARGGLLAEAVDDVEVDGFGRVWTRTAQGFSVVTAASTY